MVERPVQQPNRAKGCLIGCIALLAVPTVIGLLVLPATENKKAMEETRKEELKKKLDPSTGVLLTSQGHLDAARHLYAQFDVNDYVKADVLFSLITNHAMEARKDLRLRAQTDALTKRLSDKLLEALKIHAWNAPGTEIMAQVVCKQSISARLKAPSTAEWSFKEAGRWRNHPGYFLVRYSVDAQNSFGAKLRSNFECEVLCLTADSCEVARMSTPNP
jgi:hypothetical protein